VTAFEQRSPHAGPHPLYDSGHAISLSTELEGVDPEDYPDIEKLRILGDVAPYSREYQKLHGRLDRRKSRSLPAGKHIYARARTRRPSRPAMHPRVLVDFTTPQAGGHLIPDFDKHLRNTSPPRCIAACQVAALGSFPMQIICSALGTRRVIQSSHSLTPGTSMTSCQLSPVGISN
jgi:hypothetical protein